MRSPFREFQVRVVLDCTEIPIALPKCLHCRVMTYSHYKETHTAKYMIGIAPGGLITYVSKGNGGRTSDKQIFEENDLVDKLEPFEDHVMVDKGFLIDSVCESCMVYGPHFSGRKISCQRPNHLLEEKLYHLECT